MLTSLVKLCPTCTKFVKGYFPLITIGKHQYIHANIMAARNPKWHHRTKVGRAIHKRARLFVGEKIDQGDDAMLKDIMHAEQTRAKQNEWREKWVKL